MATDQHANKTASPELPMATATPHRRISIIWLIPLVAALVGAWLVYKTLTERGPTITISFETAEGLDAGKTPVRFREVQLGVVNSVKLSPDLSRIEATAQMDKSAEPLLTTGTQFWVVRPRLGASGVSGLGTIFSGAYIAVDPGEGAKARNFVGLDEPPVIQSYVPGRKFILHADRVGSISVGSPVIFRGITVGEILGYSLASDNQTIDFTAFVRAPHDELVRNGTHFWNVSGIDMTIGAEGVKVSTDSLQTILAGGIAFDTPDAAAKSTPSPEGTEFTLFQSQADIAEARYRTKVPFIMYFDGSVRGLQVGAPVEFRGIKIGTVSDVRLAFDPRTGNVRIPVTVEVEPERVLIDEQRADVAPPTAQESYERAEQLVSRGLRAQLASSSLLTGQLLVSLDFFPNSPPEKLRMDGKYPEIPTVPTNIEEISRSASEIVARIKDLPIPELVAELRKTVENANALLASPDVRDATKSLKNIGPLLTSLTETSNAARVAVEEANKTLQDVQGAASDNSRLRLQAASLLEELTETSRSVRVLADFLDRHPDALIRGRSGSDAQ